MMKAGNIAIALLVSMTLAVTAASRSVRRTSRHHLCTRLSLIGEERGRWDGLVGRRGSWEHSAA